MIPYPQGGFKLNHQPFSPLRIFGNHLIQGFTIFKDSPQTFL
jgi:hypothetical protein